MTKEKVELVGYVRRSKSDHAIRLELLKEAFNKAPTYLSRDGKEFVSLVISADRLNDLLHGDKEVTGVSYLEG